MFIYFLGDYIGIIILYNIVVWDNKKVLCYFLWIKFKSNNKIVILE